MKPYLINNKSTGFTLIEILIALSMFSSLMAVLMFGFSQGLSLWDKSKHQTSQWQSLEYRHGLLSRLFIRAQVATYQKVNGMYVPFFYGTLKTITFMSRDSILDFSGRTVPIKLTFIKTNNSYQLKYNQGQRYSDPSRGIKWQKQSTVLLDNLQDGSFHFEASAFPLPDDLDQNYLDANDKIRYREHAEWLEQFNADIMWRVPRKVELWFIDENAVEHRWSLPLSQQADAWTLEVYSDD